MNKVPMTNEGAERMKTELHNLKTVQRPTVIEAIATARAHGDLKENAEYHAARDQQSFIEGRILELDGKISNAQVIDVTKIPNHGKVIFGTTVSLINITDDKVTQYKIVGEDEADLKESKISVLSPIARALIGHEVGEVVMVNTPSGDLEFEIEKVEYV